MQNAAISEAVMSALTAAFPDGVKETNEQGLTPLHYALQTEGTPDAVPIALLEAMPEAAKVKTAVGRDRHGKPTGGDTPLHLAMQKKTRSEAVMSALTAAFPGGVKETNATGFTPLHYAVQTEGMPDAVPLALLKAMPDAAKVKTTVATDSDGNLTGLSLIHI